MGLPFGEKFSFLEILEIFAVIAKKESQSAKKSKN